MNIRTREVFSSLFLFVCVMTTPVATTCAGTILQPTAASTNVGNYSSQYFPDFAINQSASSSGVPVPAAVWLLGSGQLGLIGISRMSTS
jgi:hypothetical protein